MRIMLINPEPKHYTRARCAPLGILSIGSYLQSKGHTVKILNRAIEKTDINKELEVFKPHFVGCSFTSIMPVEDAIFVSKEAKKCGACVVWGGQYITCNYKIFKELDCFDFISLGEGEETWLELCEGFEKGTNLKSIPGLAYKNEDGEFVESAARPFVDLKKLPPIDYSLIDTEKTLYINYDYNNVVAMYISKGCNGRCTFCYNHAFHKNCYRERNIDHVIQEARYLKENCGVESISFADEFFGYNREHLHNICNALIEADLGLHWGAMTKIGVFEKEDFELMYKAGCRWIEFGIESGAQTTLKRMKKGMNLDRVEVDLKNCVDVGLIPLCYFIIGFPDETEEELKQTCQLLNKISYVKLISSNFLPLPGSEIYNDLLSQGRITETVSYKEVIGVSSFNTIEANYSKVPTLDLKVIRSNILWCSFTQKNYSNNKDRAYSVIKRDIKDVLKSLRGHGFKGGIEQFFSSAFEFLDVLFYAKFFPHIVKKYGLKLK